MGKTAAGSYRKHARRTLLLLLAAPAAALGFSAFPPSSHAIASPRSRGASGVMRGTRRRNSSSVSRNQLPRRRVLKSYEGGDFPSDVGDSAGSSTVVLAEDNPELRETMKREILSIAATSNRCV